MDSQDFNDVYQYSQDLINVSDFYKQKQTGKTTSKSYEFVFYKEWSYVRAIDVVNLSLFKQGDPCLLHVDLLDVSPKDSNLFLHFKKCGLLRTPHLIDFLMTPLNFL